MIIDKRNAMLSNYEVLALLREMDEKQREQTKIDPNVKFAESLKTIQFEVIQNLSSQQSPSSTQTPEQIEATLTHLKQYNLTKSEKLQLINLRPQSISELELIIEDCEDRFEMDILREMIYIIGSKLPMPGKVVRRLESGTESLGDDICEASFVVNLSNIDLNGRMKGDKLNSSHYLAQCDFCKTKCPSESSKMEKHLLEKYEDINQDERDSISDILKNTKVKKLRIYNSSFQTDTDDNTDTNNNQEIESVTLSIREKVSINRQLLKTLILTNAPLSFVEDAEVIKLFYMLKPEYKLPSLTLGQVAASWTWLREIICKNSFTNNDFQNLLILEIDNHWEKIYNLDKFIDEWLNYASQKGQFSASSIQSPSFTRFPLRYWHTMLHITPNLSEFACHLLSIPPNSATSERVWSLLDDIHMYDLNNEETIPTPKDIFDSKSVEKSLNFYIQQSYV
ncbi:10607_t:CDS:2 [Cetraspora pellucida]|uniref:DNA-directed RNA polymerase III subunit RPC9 n=1 Tax=Cetraspora pellucida TaxID=1433469 RepID=A0A9N8VYK4_9GLOM|nr:10607_t:CDS:2 [Cetraspora pellucida]